MHGDFVARSSTCARGLPRPLSDHSSGTSSLAPRPVLRDCLIHSPTIARGLRCSPLNLCSRTALTTLRPQLGDFAARPSTCARGLPRQLSDHNSGTSPLAPRPVLGDCLDHSPTTNRGLCVSTTCDWRLTYNWDILSCLDLATRLIPRLPASSRTTSVRCTYRCILYCLYDDWILNLTRNSF